MRIGLFILFLFVLPPLCEAQKMNAVWCFGDSAGIDFNNINNPVPFKTSMKTRGSSVSISDTTGNLMFYAHTGPNVGGVLLTTDIFNSNGDIMPQGDTIYGQGWYNELIIIPMPDSADKYYVFTAGVTSFLGLYYSVVNMSLDSGNGDVSTKNLQINNLQAVDALQAIKHGNGRDWWLIMEEYFPTNNKFYFYLITPSGISLSHTQNIGGDFSTNIGNLTFNHDGTRAVFTVLTGLIELMDFDRCTGMFSNVTVIENEATMSPFPRYNGNAISPNGNVFYVTSIDSISYLFQYDLTATNISATKDTLYTFNNVVEEAGYLRLAPDGKIYLSNAWNDGVNFNYPYPDTVYNFINTNLSVINAPDSLGQACDFQPYSFYLGGSRTYWGLPNNPNYELGPLTGSLCDTITSVGIEPNKANFTFSLYPNPSYNRVTLKLNSAKQQNAILSVYNNIGALLLQKPITLQTQSLDVTELPAGVYFIRIEVDEYSLVQKLIKLE